MLSIYKNECGGALIVALMLVLMLGILGITAIRNSDTDIDLSFNCQHNQKAFYIAEAGAKRAFAQIADDPTWDSGYVNTSYNGGMYNVGITNNTTNAALDDTVIVLSVGEFNGTESTVEFYVAPEIFNPFKYAMFAKDSVGIRNSMHIDSYNSDSGGYWATQQWDEGDVGSNGVIDVRNGAVVGGDVSSSLDSGVIINAGATVYGDTTSEAPEQDIPSIPPELFVDAQTNNAASTGISGSYTYNSTTETFVSAGNVTFTTGTYYFTSFILKNSANLIIPAGEKVTIYVDGNVEIKNSGTVNAGGDASNFQIYSSGDLVLKNGGDFVGTLYNPDGAADLRNSGAFYGSIVADYIIAHNSADFHYDRNLANIEFGDTGDMEIVAWREQ